MAPQPILSDTAADTLAILRQWAGPHNAVWTGPWHLARASGDRSAQGYADAQAALSELTDAGAIRHLASAWPLGFRSDRPAKDRRTAKYELRR